MNVFLSPFFLLFYTLIPLFGGGVQDARTREVSNYWFLFILVIGVIYQTFYFNPHGLALSVLFGVFVIFKPDFLPRGDSLILTGLSFSWGLLLIPVLGVTIVFGVLWNLVKRRPFNTPLPLIPFLFAGCAITLARLALL